MEEKKYKRLTFKKLLPEHATELFPIWKDKNVTKYTYVKNIHSIDDCVIKINHYLDYKYGLLGPFVVYYNNNLIGLAAGMSQEDKINIYEIFFHFHKQYWRMGLGTETVEFLLKEAFNSLNAKEVLAQAVTKNVGSWKLLEKKGFIRKKSINNDFSRTEKIYYYFMKKNHYISFDS